MKIRQIQGKVRVKIRWKRLLIVYGILCLLFPSLLFTSLNIVGGIVGGFSSSYKRQLIVHTKGAFWADLADCGDNWSGAVKGMNPANWVK